jgi:hemerythrin superfamily protein
MPQAHSGHTFGRLATGAALGLAAGLAFPAARKAVIQGPALAASDWMDALVAEHRAIEKSFDHLLKTKDTETAKREMLLSKIAYALTKHAIEEENVIYPALTEHGRADQAHHSIEEHAQAKTLVYDLRRMSTMDPTWIGKALELWTALQTHIREEETQVFPAFRDRLSREENIKLAKMMNWEGFKAA